MVASQVGGTEGPAGVIEVEFGLVPESCEEYSLCFMLEERRHSEATDVYVYGFTSYFYFYAKR